MLPGGYGYKKSPTQSVRELDVQHPEGKASEIQPTICPTEYRCYIKEGFLYVCSGCGNDTVEKIPSSSGQLPVPVALNASLPTLFKSYHTRRNSKSKDLIGKYQQILIERGRAVFAAPGVFRYVSQVFESRIKLHNTKEEWRCNARN